jgi:glycosyltransferase involved in cell wall biosynthesis
MILGEGEERSNLEALVRELGVEDDVAIPGFAHNPYAYMHRAAVFILSSLSEAMSNVLIEAMAAGTPVVATDSPGGTREALEDGAYGSLVPVGDAAAMASAICATLDEPPDVAALQRRASDFSLEKSFVQYRDLLCNCW